MARRWLLGLQSLSLLASVTAQYGASIKMSCSQLVLDRIDPIVNPGVIGTPHLHQIVGGNAFNATMPATSDPSALSTCTTCTFPDDTSNYWTAVLYFRARNGTYRRVPQLGALFHEDARGGGMTIYYFPPKDYRNMVAFKRGFRMRTGHPTARSPTDQERYPGITYTCLLRPDTRYTNVSTSFPKKPCPEGILTTIFFPPCWDGKNLDSPDHFSHVSFPASGKYDGGGACPASHPVKVPQVVLETRWDTREFNAPDLWPEEDGGDSRQPFVWSFGDGIGHGHHGDYAFGWRDDSLQRTFEKENCGDQLCGLPTQTIPEANKCVKEPMMREEVDGWLEELPGGVVADA